MSDKKLKLKVGDFWYVKFPNAIVVSEIEIKELSKKIIRVTTSSNTMGTVGQLYEISDIKFIEKVKGK